MLKFNTPKSAEKWIEKSCLIPCIACVTPHHGTYAISIDSVLDHDSYAFVTGPDLGELACEAVKTFGDNVRRVERKKQAQMARSRMYERAAELCVN